MNDLKIDGHKLDLHPERVAEWMKAKTLDEKIKVFPLYVEVSPVGHCNHRCTFCAVDYIGYTPRSISFDTMTKCLLSMAAGGVKSVMYAGEGEPLLHKDMASIVNYTRGTGIDVALTTNGVLLNPKFVEDCMFNVSWIKISLNAGNPEAYAQVHQTKPEDYNKVLHNLMFASTFRDANDLKTTIGVQTVVLPENIATVENLIIDAHCSGADYVVLKPYSQHNSSVNKYDINYKDWDFYLTGLAEKFSHETFRVIYRRESALQESRGYEKCYSTPNFWAYIMATGDVYGCSAYLLDDRFKYGNINQESFVKIWLGDKRRESLEYVENKLDISECRKNCRLDKGNQYLWQLKNAGTHDNFI